MNNSFQNVIVRQETPADFKQIEEITTKAFGEAGELVAELVNNIRKSANYIPELSLVAEKEGNVVGHLMLSYLNLGDTDTVYRVVTLSPISVEPEMQKKGIGSALIKASIKKADALGEPLIMLEGNPRYYSRFGFKSGKEFGIRIALPHWAPEGALILPLSRYMQNIKGNIIYPPYFDKVNQPPNN